MCIRDSQRGFGAQEIVYPFRNIKDHNDKDQEDQGEEESPKELTDDIQVKGSHQ